ncbi:torsin-1A [Daktulosphaira vitifoliae]|uniref:torsin-1A n=1 Tax=Daktulosphaira vitifoliae TaxID=58002 RepID=UPI0021A977F3|nr:torsin-1A [Daktulosphaira vitifoliae]
MLYIIKYCPLFIYHLMLINSTHSLIDPLTGTIVVGAFIGGLYLKKFNYTTSIQNFRFSEILSFSSCRERIDLNGLKNDLDKHFFGQHIASNIILSALKGNSQRSEKNRKPLVMSFHGWTGVGKNFVTHLIANHIFTTEKSKKLQYHIINGRSSFTNSLKYEEYQETLFNKVYSDIKICPTNIFVFDEITKIPHGILDILIPIFENNVSTLDSRNSIFIFLTNTGEDVILDRYLQLWKKGYTREQMNVEHFDSVLQISVFNEQSGLKKSDIIDSHIIDHYVPFLPLEKSHVIQCIETELRNLNVTSSAEIIETVMQIITFGPEPERLFSLSGCKRIGQKVTQVVNQD